MSKLGIIARDSLANRRVGDARQLRRSSKRTLLALVAELQVAATLDEEDSGEYLHSGHRGD